MPLRVLISGAGIAGPVLAWHLSKIGARVTIVEKTRSPLPHGQNIDISGSAITVVKKMELLEEVRRCNTTEKGTQLIDPQGRPFACFPVKEGAIASATSEFEILRGDLAAILYEASKDLPGVDYKFWTTVDKVISNDDDCVRVKLSNGEEQEFDLVVAADGQWSKVRKQCFTPEDVTVVDKGAYAAYFTVPRLPSDNDLWNIYIALRSRIIGIRPDPHGTSRVIFTLMPCNDRQKQEWQEASRGDRKTQEELMRREFADAGWQAHRFLDAMGQAPDFYFQAIQQIKMSKWSNSRVVCLGDAAFAPTPFTGMGTSLAIIGAHILAGELSKLDDGEHVSKALEAYENTLRPFVEEIQQIPAFIPGILHPGTAWKRWLIQSLISTMSRVVALATAIPWVSQRFAVSAEANDDGFKLPPFPRFD
ncbi:FAD/NAD(P)-binding domain-containing protein [Dothidotthia symphoricarpi CBS 119687]|uniref:FAD/NAD(P)-binding domain-containing protein n=1 Tax=Dothidotthia symphoricarpi CBS 119687 TaxID=1392245 RepID=A0A6A6A139_9PLEO|nr:FAD/NAD(P)-binding domain-containing protein [Dothidotthia symphoricarpi CBS 119687]KAF2125722.1 FAD/NAD(P)-binding domain-containing protein [Dothidotthia symphoricarpi CBS 119687]